MNINCKFQISELIMKRALMIFCVLWLTIGAVAQTSKGVDLTKATLVYHEGDTPLARKMAEVLADDIERVSGVRPQVSTRPKNCTRCWNSYGGAKCLRRLGCSHHSIPTVARIPSLASEYSSTWAASSRTRAASPLTRAHSSATMSCLPHSTTCSTQTSGQA